MSAFLGTIAEYTSHRFSPSLTPSYVSAQALAPALLQFIGRFSFQNKQTIEVLRQERDITNLVVGMRYPWRIASIYRLARFVSTLYYLLSDRRHHTSESSRFSRLGLPIQEVPFFERFKRARSRAEEWVSIFIPAIEESVFRLILLYAPFVGLAAGRVFGIAALRDPLAGSGILHLPLEWLVLNISQSLLFALAHSDHRWKGFLNRSAAGLLLGFQTLTVVTSRQNSRKLTWGFFEAIHIHTMNNLYVDRKIRPRIQATDTFLKIQNNLFAGLWKNLLGHYVWDVRKKPQRLPSSFKYEDEAKQLLWHLATKLHTYKNPMVSIEALRSYLHSYGRFFLATSAPIISISPEMIDRDYFRQAHYVGGMTVDISEAEIRRVRMINGLFLKMESKSGLDLSDKNNQLYVLNTAIQLLETTEESFIKKTIPTFWTSRRGGISRVIKNNFLKQSA